MSNPSRDVPVCVICRLEEKDLQKILKCEFCRKSAHIKCKKISSSAIRKLRDQVYYCSIACKKSSQQPKQIAPMDSQVLEEVRMVLSEVRETRAELQAMKTTIGEVEKFQNFLSEKLDSVLKEMKTMKNDQAELKSRVDVLNVQQQTTADTVEQLELDVDRLKRNALSKNAVVIGVPMVKNESTTRVVYNICSALGYNLPNGAVLEAYRMGTKDTQQSSAKSPPIKVVFADEKFKEEMLSKKKNHGPLLLSAVDAAFGSGNGKILLRDELTPYGVNLLKEIRQVQELADLKYVWPGRNGAILVKKTENSRIEIIRRRSEVERLQRKNLKRLIPVSPSDPAAKR